MTKMLKLQKKDLKQNENVSEELETLNRIETMDGKNGKCRTFHSEWHNFQQNGKCRTEKCRIGNENFTG